MENNNTFWIGGIHAVLASIKNKKRDVKKILTTEKIKNLDDLAIKYEIVERKKIAKLFENQDFQFQNIAAEITIFPKTKLTDELLEKVSNLIILDGVTDPRNIGSIFRSAVAFNVNTIILREKDYPSKSPVMFKTASGAMEYINIVEVSNLNNIIKLLKKNNFWLYGFDSNSKNNFNPNNMSNKNVFVFGSEGKGISKKIVEKCDFLTKLNTSGLMPSLNVSNAVSSTLSLIAHYHSENN